MQLHDDDRPEDYAVAYSVCPSRERLAETVAEWRRGPEGKADETRRKRDGWSIEDAMSWHTIYQPESAGAHE